MKISLTFLITAVLISSCSQSNSSSQKDDSSQNITISQEDTISQVDSSSQEDNLSQSEVNTKSDETQSVNDYISIAMLVDKESKMSGSPIDSILQFASAKADKSIVLTKDNMKVSLQNATTYKSCLITVGNHTVVLISDFNNEIASGSWGCQMPMGKGYIKRGEIEVKEDYINNIIGVPDTQKRNMYLFK